MKCGEPAPALSAMQGMSAMVLPRSTRDGSPSLLPSPVIGAESIADMPCIADTGRSLVPEIGRGRRPKTGGRAKGTPNRVTTDVRAAIRDLAESNAGRVQEWLDRVAQNDPAEAVRLFLNLCRYVVPVLSAAAIADITPKAPRDALYALSNAELLAILHEEQPPAKPLVQEPALALPNPEEELLK